jgi:hypothetical protein
MGEHEQAPLSRRALIAGAGGAAGVAAFGGLSASSAGAAEPPIGPNDPTQDPGGRAQASGFPPLAVVPGTHYRTWSQFAFQPPTSGNGRDVSGSGSFCTSGGYLVAAVDLEANSLLTELTVGVTNTSGSTAFFSLDSYPLDGGSNTEIGVVYVPSGDPSIQMLSTALNHRTIASWTYLGSALTDVTIRVYSMRLGYIPFGYGFTPITPVRVYDSRPGNPPLAVAKGPLSNGTRTINLLTGLTLPVTPQGVLTVLTVVNTSASGFLALWRAGIGWPGTSSINWFTANEIVANAAYTDLDAAGNALVKVPANASTDFFVDVVGYYA